MLTKYHARDSPVNDLGPVPVSKIAAEFHPHCQRPHAGRYDDGLRTCLSKVSARLSISETLKSLPSLVQHLKLEQQRNILVLVDFFTCLFGDVLTRTTVLQHDSWSFMSLSRLEMGTENQFLLRTGSKWFNSWELFVCVPNNSAYWFLLSHKLWHQPWNVYFGSQLFQHGAKAEALKSLENSMRKDDSRACYLLEFVMLMQIYYNINTCSLQWKKSDLWPDTAHPSEAAERLHRAGRRLWLHQEHQGKHLEWSF